MTKLLERPILKDLVRWKNTTTWSIEGFLTAWREEKSLRQWVVVNLFSWGAIYWLGIGLTQASILIALGGLVVVVELINSAIETTVDYVSTDRHPLAKKAKDVASAAVFVTALLWALIWLLTLLG